MSGAEGAIAGATCFATRSGYTGEDGFEISVAAEEAERVARALLAEPEVAPAGLGARDTLAAGSGSVPVRPRHRQHDDAGRGRPHLGDPESAPRRRRARRRLPGRRDDRPQLSEGAARKRVGLLGLERVPVREGARMLDVAGEPVGQVTSGTIGPSVGQPIALAYVSAAHAAIGTLLHADVRGKHLPMRVAALPFAPHHYFRG